jgi:formate hydrogenlyase transcriptional activator
MQSLSHAEVEGILTPMDDRLPQGTIQVDSARYGALLQVVEAIASHADLQGLVQDLARLLPLLVPVNFVGLSLYDAQRDMMRLHVLRANVPADIIGGQESHPSDTPAGLVWQTQQPVFLSDLAKNIGGRSSSR